MFQMAKLFRGKEWAAASLPERHRKNARRVKNTILEVKGLFIKIGQLISMMTNFLPDDFRHELDELQDRVPPRPYESIVNRIRGELNSGPDEFFESFNPSPIASASLAQVHDATLRDGRRVALKIQHIDVDEMVKEDLLTLRNIHLIAGFFARVRGLDNFYTQIRDMIFDELDFEKEADHIETVSANFENEMMVSFPEVVREYSTRRILVTSFIEGIKITDQQEIEMAGLDTRILAQRILTAYCHMIFEDGVYHADPHPGNIFVGADGEIIFVDFGAIGKLSQHMKEGIPMFLEAVIRRDTGKILKALRMMGFVAKDGNYEIVERLIEYFQRRFIEQITLDSWSLKDIQVDLKTKLDTMADFRELDISFRDLTSSFQVPKDWALLQRTFFYPARLMHSARPGNESDAHDPAIP